jgi:hypothetical protein
MMKTTSRVGKTTGWKTMGWTSSTPRFEYTPDRSVIEGAPQQLVTDAEALVREWAAEFGIDFDERHLQGLCWSLGGIVDECAVAAAINPEALKGASRG